MKRATANMVETHIQIGDASVIITSDNEDNGSDQSEDLFDSYEDSCDVPEMGANVSATLNLDKPSTSGMMFHHSDVIEESSQNSLEPLSSKERKLRENMQQSVIRLESEDKNAKNFGYYMQLKKDKLRYQVNVLDRPQKRSSDIFNGISIFVNGHTEPTALELRQLIQLHGGEYHCYYQYGVTSFIIATSLATAKVPKTRQNEKYVRPEWIVDSIAVGKLLNTENYVLLPAQKKETTLTSLQNKQTSDDHNNDQRILDARDPHFLEAYYARSRLHLISTLAQELKEYVTVLRAEERKSFIGRETLDYLRDNNYKSSSSRIIFHVDLDCFFVSVALRDRPDLKDKPVAITHSKGVGAGFSELASVSYAARRCGLRNGMIVRDAIKRCPQLICLPYAFDQYKIVSKAIYTIVARYTLEIKAVSCDEMYIDCTRLLSESEKDCESGSVLDARLTQLAHRMTNFIGGCGKMEELDSNLIPSSIMILHNIDYGKSTLMARLATRYAKPDGVRYILAEESHIFIANEKVKNLPGLGYQTYNKLAANFGNIERCSNLQQISQINLERVLGKKLGEQLYKMCRGESEDREFITSSIRKSISCDINYGIRFTKKSEVAHFLNVVGLELEKKLLSAKMATRSITLKLMMRSAHAPVQTPKYLGHGECDVQNKSASLDNPTGSAQVITAVALKLFTKMAPVITDLRGVGKIGVQCGRLVLAAEVGYSMKSEVINRMFCARDSKKDEQKDAQAAQKRESCQERKLPPAFSIEPPSFFGEKSMLKIKEDLFKYFKNEPNEDAVGIVTDFLFYLLRDGCLTTLTSTCLLIQRGLYSSEVTTDPGWLFAINVIFDSLDEKCCKMYGAPAIRPAILKCKEC